MGILRRLSSAVSLAAAVTFALVETSFAETRVALVIGNGTYQNAPLLPNPPNDANDVAAALTHDGFDTILATNLSKDGMQEAAIRFARAARDADVAMFYYSGHAIQFAGVNYLAPVDIKLNDEADLRRMIRVDEIISDLQQAKNLSILVLDSCRDNPLADQLKRSIGANRSLPLQRGLAKIDSPQGMIVAYATQAGRTADDGDGHNSPYTAAFLKNIEAQEEIGTIFRRISADVYETTKHEQLPELSLSLIGEFYLRGKIEINVRPEPAIPSDKAKEDFEAAERVDTVGGWAAFLARHPDGYYAALAKERQTKAAAKIAALPNNAGQTETTQNQAFPGEFVFLRDIDPTIIQDIRYAGSNNFVGRPLAGYDAAECVVKRSVGLALKSAQQELAVQKLSLKILDCYRPSRAVHDMVVWAQNGRETPAEQRYNPNFSKSDQFRLGHIAEHSGHSTGAAVDLTLVDLRHDNSPQFDPNKAYADCTAPASARAPEASVDMGTGYDCSDVKAHTAAQSITPEQRRWRNLLVTAMARQGFVNYAKEWWHFSVPSAAGLAYDFPIISPRK
jgi:zinc D-Ala-D-Ala dipeptidase